MPQPPTFPAVPAPGGTGAQPSAETWCLLDSVCVNKRNAACCKHVLLIHAGMASQPAQPCKKRVKHRKEACKAKNTRKTFTWKNTHTSEIRTLFRRSRCPVRDTYVSGVGYHGTCYGSCGYMDGEGVYMNLHFSKAWKSDICGVCLWSIHPPPLTILLYTHLQAVQAGMSHTCHTHVTHMSHTCHTQVTPAQLSHSRVTQVKCVAPTCRQCRSNVSACSNSIPPQPGAGDSWEAMA